MSYWGQLGFPDPGTEMTQKLILYHDLTCLTMVGIGAGIGFFLLSFYSCSFWNKSVKKNEKVEFWWTFLPSLWLVFLSYPSLRNLFKMECEASSAGVILQVVGHQWYWSYDYSFLRPVGGEVSCSLVPTLSKPAMTYGKWGWFKYMFKMPWMSGVSGDLPIYEIKDMKDYSFSYDSFMVSTNELSKGDYRLLEVDHRVVLPLTKVLLSITSADVIHSWSVPSLGVKMDAVPGKHNILEFKPSRCGIYYGQCAEICGVNHSYMPIVVEVVSESMFSKWVDRMWLYSQGVTKFQYTFRGNIWVGETTESMREERRVFRDKYYKVMGWPSPYSKASK